MNISQSMTEAHFHDGEPAKIFTLSNKNGSNITLMDIGATWISCQIQLEDETREVLLGVDSLAKHLAQQAYLGATVGRYANRIKHGKFSIEADQFQLDLNQGENTLHGGNGAFDKRRWQVLEEKPNQIIFQLFSADGEQGFPGNLTATVSYSFTDDNEVVIEYAATTDKACPVNFTNHAYFNLLGAESGENCLQHSLQLAAEQYVPTDEFAIPLGPLKRVENTGFDFLTTKMMKQHFMLDHDQKLLSGYDHAYLINADSRDGEKPVASLYSPDQRLEMQLRTTKPGVQVYTGNFLAGCPSRGVNTYSVNAGIALETQFLPDSPNHPEWPQPTCILYPDQTYHSKTSYKFVVNPDHNK
ncbi:MAG: galactose-1-epimerase [Psychromonas sp.]